MKIVLVSDTQCTHRYGRWWVTIRCPRNATAVVLDRSAHYFCEEHARKYTGRLHVVEIAR